MIVTSCRVLRNSLKSYGEVFAFDTETYEEVPPGCVSVKKKGALVLDRARMSLFSAFGEADGGSFSLCVPMREIFGSGFMSSRECCEVLKEFMQSRKILKIAHNLNYDANVLMNHGVRVNCGFCTLTAARHQDENNPADLKSRAVQIGMLLQSFKNVDVSDIDEFCKYAEQDAEAAYRLWCAYTGLNKEDDSLKISEENMRILIDQELPLLNVVLRMEREGVLIDREKFAAIEETVTRKKAEHEEAVFRIIGAPINLNSPKQLQKVLYGDMEIEPPEGCETKTGFSTDENTLRDIGESIPIVSELLGYRQMDKLLKIVSCEQGVPSYADSEGYIHTTLSTTGAQTFRFSSSLPNLQNIPLKRDVFGIRGCFVAPEGMLLSVLDYDRMELVMAANICRDRFMLNVLTSENDDLHQAMADNLSMRLTGTLGHIARDLGKTLNFALLYGMSARKLAKVLTLQGYPTDTESAKLYVAGFFEAYADVAIYKERQIFEYDRCGYVEYASGRRRTIPNMHASSKRLRRYGERQLYNSSIQGCERFTTKVLFRDVGYEQIGKAFEEGRTEREVWDGHAWRRCTILNRGLWQLADIKLKSGHLLHCDTRHSVLVVGTEGYEFRKFEDLKIGDNVCLSPPAEIEYGKWPKVPSVYVGNVHNSTTVRVWRKSGWLGVAYLLGCYVGDGHISQSRQVTFCGGIDKVHKVFPKLREYLREIGILHIPVKRSRGSVGLAYKIVVSSKQLIDLFHDLGVKEGWVSRTKRVPDAVWGFSLEMRKTFLLGYHEADGCHKYDGNKFGIHTPNEDLLRDVQLLANTVGLSSAVFATNSDTHKLTWHEPSRMAKFLGVDCPTSRSSGPTKMLVPDFLREQIGIALSSVVDHKEEWGDYVLTRRVLSGGPLTVFTAIRLLEKYSLDIGTPLYYHSPIVEKTELKEEEETFTLMVYHDGHRLDSEGIISKNSCADYLKDAMLRIGNDKSLQRWRCKVVLQVHDELLCYIPVKPRHNVRRCVNRVKALMGHVPDSTKIEIIAPFKVGAGVGMSWKDAK